MVSNVLFTVSLRALLQAGVVHGLAPGMTVHGMFSALKTFSEAKLLAAREQFSVLATKQTSSEGREWTRANLMLDFVDALRHRTAAAPGPFSWEFAPQVGPQNFCRSCFE